LSKLASLSCSNTTHDPPGLGLVFIARGSAEDDVQSCHRLIFLTGPKKGWTHYPNSPRMCNGILPNGEPQLFYFPEDHPSMPSWFKGMEIVIDLTNEDSSSDDEEL